MTQKPKYQDHQICHSKVLLCPTPCLTKVLLKSALQKKGQVRPYQDLLSNTFEVVLLTQEGYTVIQPMADTALSTQGSDQELLQKR